MMHLEYLESFLAVAQYHNFTEAARSLGISQSSLTKRIHNLEESLGFRLFERTTREVRLTAVGSLYLTYADKIADVQDAFDAQLARNFSNGNSLAFGMIPSASEYGLTSLISAFMRDTNHRCSVFTSRSEDLEVMLDEGRCDFAFIKNDSGTHSFTRLPIARDHMVLVVAKAHPLARRASVSVSELANERFFFEPKDSRPYLDCVELCRTAGFEPNIVGTDSQIANIVDYVAQGVGVSLLMRRIVPADPRVALISISPHVQASIDLCYRPGRLTGLQREFLDYLKDSRRG
ncbi:transcription regulator [Bifidobacterium goeldii]|uniref:Transcription regulator n=1 Tax=Bifidobacterium goeldii TaxID=2306975 RepID=A0A430FK87_9BIFI|nr:LysR family transcriptional regulator [Bifidobacterium goeldii]RSX53151.1 transcription regulator [Bifidobacterium goeldii]